MNIRNKHDRDPEWDKVNHPTQEEIIAHNRKENKAKEEEEYKHNIPELHLKNDKLMVLVEKDLLEKLKNFDFWKEWRNQR